MPDEICQLCEREDVELRTLTRDETGDTVHACPMCLRSRTRAKAARSDPRAYEVLRKEARGTPLEIWRRDHVIYLLSPLDTSTREPEKLVAGMAESRGAGRTSEGEGPPS